MSVQHSSGPILGITKRNEKITKRRRQKKQAGGSEEQSSAASLYSITQVSKGYD
jgi:hypothetical protein